VEWATDMVRRQIPGANVHLEPVRSQDWRTLVAYLTKQWRDPTLMEAWPRYFRLPSASDSWCPDWKSAKEREVPQTFREAGFR
jgi:hypothetical protein